MDVNLSELTPPQQHRYYALKSVYGDSEAYKIVKVLHERGRNSYMAFIDKMNMWQGDMPDELQHLYNELYLVFPLNEIQTTNDIIEKVTQARVKFGFGFFRSKVRQECEKLFFNLFAVEDVTENVVVNGNNAIQVVGYKPLARTKPPHIR